MLLKKLNKYCQLLNESVFFIVTEASKLNCPFFSAFFYVRPKYRSPGVYVSDFEGKTQVQSLDSFKSSSQPVKLIR